MAAPAQADSLQTAVTHLKFFLSYDDTDGAVGSANAIAASAKALLDPEPLLKLRVVELLIKLIRMPRADAQAAAAGARRLEQ